MAQTFDAIVIGAGPAGLSAAAELSREGSCLLVEQGPPAAERKRDAPRDVLSGVGGAGLFSDGKHSFFPSATELWRLPDRAALAGAFGATAELLAKYGVLGEELPDGPPPAPPAGEWIPKVYPSLYVPFDQRLACIEKLWSSCPQRRSAAHVTGAGRAGAEIVLDLSHSELRTKNLVVATGRWSPRTVRSWLEALGVRYEFQRVEFGVRLEANADDPLFERLPGVDGKLRFVDPHARLEIRTFCTCRNGEVVLGEHGGVRAYSGRADGPRTDRSNVGLVVRTLDAQIGREIAERFAGAEPCSFPLSSWPGPLASLFGDSGAALLTRALERFTPPQNAIVYAPCIEGIGDYPADDGNLLVAPGVHVAGDAIGRFRGIVASMISGRYAARRIR